MDVDSDRVRAVSGPKDRRCGSLADQARAEGAVRMAGFGEHISKCLRKRVDILVQEHLYRRETSERGNEDSQDDDDAKGHGQRFGLS